MGLTKGEGSGEFIRAQFQDSIAMSHGHCEDEVSVGDNFRGQLPCCKSRRVSAKLLEDERSVGMNGMADHCPGAGAGRTEIGDALLDRVSHGEAFSCWRPADVTCAYKQDVQRDS